MAPWIVGTPVKGVAVGTAGMTPDFAVARITGGGAPSWTRACALARAPKASRGRDLDNIVRVEGGLLWGVVWTSERCVTVDGRCHDLCILIRSVSYLL
jgi:hypothetical protein